MRDPRRKTHKAAGKTILMQHGIAHLAAGKATDTMGDDKNFPWIPLVIFVIFGILCFVGGTLCANIANKKRLNVMQARLFESEHKFLSFSMKVINNTDAAVKISGGVSSAWHGSVENGNDLNTSMERFLDENKDAALNMKVTHDLLESQLSELRKYLKESQGEFEAVMELYDVYNKLYALALNPSGGLKDFDNNRESLSSASKQVQSKLLAYMPELKAELSERAPEAMAAIPTANVLANDVSATKKSGADKNKFPVSDPPERVSYDSRIKKVTKDMTYRQVESQAGVPRQKKKDSQGQEVWIYPSEKAGFRNVVYFASGKVLQSNNKPIAQD